MILYNSINLLCVFSLGCKVTINNFLPLDDLEEKAGLVSESYGEDDFSKMEGEEDGYNEDDDENSRQSVGILLHSNQTWIAGFTRT